ncbi:hypothetical protein [Brevundimonas sp.]|uniref:hypothetical protein n=1 Tax=Brevundimonas sp. TaxID=1871086 RepID=UPI0028B1EF1F|nr:hypothetical protein [Brevundimonas sp.]
MPNKHADTDRWGGPGASHENRNKARPDPLVKDDDAPDHLSPRSQISGGGGEGDVHKGHSAKAKHEKRSTSQEKRHERDGRH